MEGRRSTRSGRLPRRPRRITIEKIEKAVELRKAGLPWAIVARHVGLPAETCRKMVRVDCQGHVRL